MRVWFIYFCSECRSVRIATVKMKTTVDDLIKSPFLNRSLEAKLKIVAAGKPRPLLNMAAAVTTNAEEADACELRTYEFKPAMYDTIEWLTGCDKRDTFYCWPCLLFMPSVGLWNTTGISDLVLFLEDRPKHEKSFEHIQSTLKLQELVEQNAKTLNIDVGEHNEMVKRNRAILKRMIDVVCNLLTKEQPSYERINRCELDPENCVKNLKFLRCYDVLNCNYIEDAIDLIQISPNIVNDLVNSVTKTVQMAIKKELHVSTYVSIILSDHSVLAENLQISTVLRYLKGEKICERFIGFSNLGRQTSLDVIYQHITNVINEFGLQERFFAVALDGGIVDTKELPELISMLKDVYPFAFFVPWYGHGLDAVLQQSLANMGECSAFFQAMNEMKFFFQKKSKRFKVFETFMERCMPDAKNTRWFVRSQFIQVVNTYRKNFVQFFDSILQSSTLWEPDDITKAMGFMQILDDFHTVFLLEALTKLFDHTAVLNKILKSSSPEKVFSSAEIFNLNKNLLTARDTGFDSLWLDIEFKKCNEKPGSPLTGPPLKKVKIDVDDPKVNEYRTLYTSIINRMVSEIDTRFFNLGRLSFCQLLGCDKFGNFIFSNDMLQTLMSVQGAYFDEEQIKNELIVLRTNWTVFAKKSVYDILNFLTQSKLKGSFKYICKLAEFILTLPIKPPAEEANKTKFKDIQDWSYIPETPLVPPGDVSIPCVELEFLHEMKKASSFHDEIAVIFYELNKTFELLHR